jgi:hypothetical protein
MTGLPDEDTVPARRSGSIEVATTEGSTVIAHRESRRRESRRAENLPDAVDAPVAAVDPSLPAPPSPRRAAPPAAAPTYGARAAEPFIAVRTEPDARVPQVPVDGSAAAAAHRRRARRTALIVLAAASALAVAAATALLIAALAP